MRSARRDYLDIRTRALFLSVLVFAASLLSLTVASPARCETVSLGDLSGRSLGAQADILFEADRPLALEQAQDLYRKGDFRAAGAPVLTFGIGARPVWVHLAVNNPTPSVLPMHLLAGVTWLDHLDAYLVHDDRPERTWHTGDETVEAPGVLAAQGYDLAMAFQPGRSDIFLRVQCIDPLVLPITLMSQAQLDQGKGAVTYFYGLIYGYLTALFAYNLLIFFGLGDRGHLYYSATLLGIGFCNVAYTGHGLAFLWPGQVTFQRYVILVAMVLYSSMALTFTCQFLRLSAHSPRVVRLVRTIAGLGAAAMAVSVLLGSQLAAALVAFVFVGVISLMVLALGAFSIRKGIPGARYFMGATVFGTLGATSTLLAVWGKVPFTSAGYHGVEFGVVIEATLWALALANNLRQQQLAAMRAEALSQNEERLRQALADAEAANQAKSTFLATMSHEIRTPLSAAVGMTDLMLHGPLSSEQAEQIQTIRASTRALLAVVDDILDLSKLDAGRIEIEPVPFSLGQVLTDIELVFRAKAIERQIGFAITVGEGVPDGVMGDVTRLRQVLLNLVSNAVKFTESGEVRVHVAVDGDNRLRFEIRDTGIGIDDKTRGRLFEDFSQADNSIARRYGGTGLGLAISRRLVQLMGGTIGVESRPGQGSNFHFTLPLTPAIQLPEERGEAVDFASPLDLLVAEDNPINAKVLEALLRRAGHRVTVVGNGKSAIDAVAARRFDAVLMDMQMPVMDGLAATRAIRDLPGGAAGTPIIGVTANAFVEDQQRCLDAGMNGYVSKPVTQAKLSAAIRAVGRSGPGCAAPAMAPAPQSV